MPSEEAVASLRLLLADGVGHARARALRDAFGSACAALDASAAAVAAAIRVGEADAARMLREARGADVGGELRVLDEKCARIVLEHDDEYPALLRASTDPPAMLFACGDVVGPARESQPEIAVAIVGSRSATTYGVLQAGRIACELAERGITVVSGGARGIDAEAHRGALRAGGRTIAVVATGLAHPYPAAHEPLFAAIVEAGGCVMTEQPAAVTVRADLFPRRNRIIAALGLVTVVVEAAHRSGALLTARIAVEDLSRDVGCVPGPVESALSEGCHRAIREGWARLVTGADDVCEMIADARSLAMGAVEVARRERPPRKKPAVDAKSDAPRAVSDDARAVLTEVRNQRRAGLDELERALGWPIPRLACATLELEVAGAVERDAQGAFKLRGARIAPTEASDRKDGRVL